MSIPQVLVVEVETTGHKALLCCRACALYVGLTICVVSPVVGLTFERSVWFVFQGQWH